MFKEITPDELRGWIEGNKDIQIVDVREPYEFEEEHIDNAKLIPLGSIQSRIEEIDKNRPVVFVCRSGSRSRMASQFAGINGYDSYNLSGGMLSWKSF